MNIILTIKGRIPAKSSLQRIGFNKRTGKRFMYTTEEVKNYEQAFALQVPKSAKRKLNPNSRLEVYLVVYADSYRQDVDSFSKIVLDTLQACEVIENDNRIDKLHITRIKDKDPRVVINISEL